MTYDTASRPTKWRATMRSRATSADPAARAHRHPARSPSREPGVYVTVGLLVNRQPVRRARQHRPQKLLGVGGLDRVAVGAELRRLAHFHFAAYARHHHDGNLAQFRVVADLLERLEPVDARHLDVEEDQPRARRARVR